jgi:hypothetical protein
MTVTEPTPEELEDDKDDEDPEEADPPDPNGQSDYAEDAPRPLPGGGINRSGSPVDHGLVHRWHADG